MNLNKYLLVLLIAFLTHPTFSQTWQDDSLVVRQILDTNGLYTVMVDSVVAGKDSTGRVVNILFTKWPLFHVLPASIKQLDKLMGLTIYNTNLASIPSEIGNLALISVLRLYNNKLTSIPSEIGNLDSIKILSIDHNEITAIPPEIGNCKKLYFIQFQHNKITRIPDEICEMDALNKIWADNNLISYVPENIGNMPAFHAINLEYNKLKHVPNSLIPYTLDDVHLCFNDSLIFTEEQKTEWGVTDYDDFFWKHCPVEVEEDVVQKQLKNSQIRINSQSILLRVNHNGHITCSVYNLCGRRIEILVNGVLSAGTHSMSWNRARYAPGIYFGRYCAVEGHSFSRKVVVK